MPSQAASSTLHPPSALPAGRWVAKRVDSVAEFLRRCELLQRSQAPTPFQNSHWLEAWYAHLAGQPGQSGVEPLLIALRREGDAGDSMLLPFVRRRQGGLTVIEAADLGITDYNAPLLAAGWSPNVREAGAIWRSLRPLLRGADLLHLEKWLGAEAGQANPLSLALPSLPSPMFGNRFSMGDDYAAWMASLGKHARKEFERHWRVFTRHEGSRFVRAANVGEGLSLLRQLAELQHRRREQTAGYFLDQPAYAAFYEDYLRNHLDSGRCVVTALMAGDEMVAGLFSVFDGQRLTMLRVAMGSEAWKPCAPGKLLLERSIAEMHGRGCREFDFAIGDYAHKRVFQTTALPLQELCVPLSWKGLPWALAWRARHALRQQAWLRQAVQRLRALRR